jgi:GTP cyclohydrolase II
VDSNRILGFPDDARHYECVPSVLADLGVRSVRLITNNPRKIEALRSLGVAVSGRVHVELHESDVAEPYLQAKRARMGHMLEH